MRNVLLLAVCTAILILPIQAEATRLSIGSEPDAPVWADLFGGEGVAQAFTVGDNFELNSISVAAAVVGHPTNATLALYSGSDGVPQDLLSQWEVHLNPMNEHSVHWVHGAAPGGIVLTANTTYWAALFAPQGSTLEVLLGDREPPTPGLAWYHEDGYGVWTPSDEGSMMLRLGGVTSSRTSVIPEVTGIMIMSSGIAVVCMGSARSRLRRKNSP